MSITFKTRTTLCRELWVPVLATALACGQLFASSNCVVNGSFEQSDPAQPGKPLAWEMPDGLGAKWIDSDDPGHGKVIALDTSVSEAAMVQRWNETGLTNKTFASPSNGPIAGTYGLSYYSDTFHVVSGMTYRVSFDLKQDHGGGGAKVWVRGYGKLRGRKRRLYEKVVHCRAGKDTWKSFSEEFHPTRHRGAVTEMKVMLYAYHPPSTYRFDNILIEMVGPDNAEKFRTH